MVTEISKMYELMPPAVQTVTVNGAFVNIADMGGGNMMMILHIGAVSGVSPTLDVKLQDADDLSGTNVADVPGVVFVTKSGPGIYRMNVKMGSIRQIIRAVCTIGGTTPSFACAVSVAVEESVNPVAAQL